MKNRILWLELLLVCGIFNSLHPSFTYIRGLKNESPFPVTFKIVDTYKNETHVISPFKSKDFKGYLRTPWGPKHYIEIKYNGKKFKVFQQKRGDVDSIWSKYKKNKKTKIVRLTHVDIRQYTTDGSFTAGFPTVRYHPPKHFILTIDFSGKMHLNECSPKTCKKRMKEKITVPLKPVTDRNLQKLATRKPNISQGPSSLKLRRAN